MGSRLVEDHSCFMADKNCHVLVFVDAGCHIGRALLRRILPLRSHKVQEMWKEMRTVTRDCIEFVFFWRTWRL